MATYSYEPLLKRSTRLIELEPSGSFKAPVRINLFRFFLDKIPRYHALSYSWGGQIPQQQIICNGNSWLKVTQNVETALRYLRLPNQPHFLWIDSICIDQSSVAERNQQISIMKDIYERADQVLVWLGEASNSSSTAIHQLTPLSDRRAGRSPSPGDQGAVSGAARSVYADEIAPQIAKGIVKAGYAIFGGSMTAQSKVGSEGTGMSHLLSRSVFTRMWCVQEMALGRVVVLICGKDKITLDQMIEGLDRKERVLGKTFGMDSIIMLYKSRIGLQKELRDTVRALRSPFGAKNFRPLSDIIYATRFRGATDPKDKVFSLVGMFQLMGLDFPLPDYSKSVREVYQDVTVAAINTSRNLDILYQVAGLPNEFNLPSWVPDISDISPPAQLQVSAFDASRNTTPVYICIPTDNTLKMHAKAVDAIVACGTPLNLPESLESRAISPAARSTIALAALKNWHTLATRLQAYPTGEPIAQVFGRTLLSDGAIPGLRDSKALFDTFPKWLAVLVSKFPEGLLIDNESLQRSPGGDAASREFDLSLHAATLVQTMSMGGRDQVKIKNLHDWLHLNLRRKRLFITDRGYMGVASAALEVGDVVVLIKGLRLPFLVRRGTPGSRLIAPAYICGIMLGEFWEGGAGMEEFVLV